MGFVAVIKEWHGNRGNKMVKKIRLLGMEMDNFTLQEELMLSEAFYHKQELNIIRTVSIEMLSLAADSQAVRDGIGQADLLVVGDREILTEAGIYSAQRLREAGEHGFMREFLSRTCHSQSSFFLVAQGQGELGAFHDFLKTKYEKIRIVGSYVLDAGSDGGGRMLHEAMVNEINAAAPDIILSVLGSPLEDGFLLQEKAKIGARVWYSLGAGYQDVERKPSALVWFRQLIHKGRFKNIIHQYEDKEWG